MIGARRLHLIGDFAVLLFFLLSRAGKGFAQDAAGLEGYLSPGRDEHAFARLGVACSGLRVGLLNGKRSEAACFDSLSVDDRFSQ